MSERVEKRVIELIEGPLVSPYGNPVPGLEDLGVEPQEAQDRHELAISEAFSGATVTAVVTRIGETPQAEPEFLAQLIEIGVFPGRTVTIVPSERGIGLEAEGGAITVTEEDARHLFVRSR